MSDSASDARSALRRRASRRTLVVTLMVLGLACVASAAPVWLTTSGTTALAESIPVTVKGTTAAPAVSAAALVIVAAGLALGLVGRVARWISLAVVAVGGLVIGGSALSVILSPDDVARSGIAEATGIAGEVGAVEIAVAPYITVVLGAAIVLTAVWAAVARIDWRTRTSKYETHAAAAAPTRVPDERDTWDSLSHGEDPT